MLGLVSFSELQLSWSDPIPWEKQGVFTSDQPNMMRNILLVYFASIVFFYSLQQTLEHIAENYGRLFLSPSNEFFKMTLKVKREYYSRILSDVHAIESLTLAIYSMWYACSDPTESIFSSYQCCNQPHLAAIYGIVISAGYCTSDLYVSAYEIKFTLKEMQDYIFHHVVGIVGGAFCLMAGNFVVAVAISNMLAESSNFFMNTRWRLLKHKMPDHWLFMAASAGFTLAFFCSRVFFMLVLTVRMFQMNFQFPSSEMHPLIYLMTVAFELCQVLIYSLQLWWFYQIVIVFYRTATGGY
jgi:hypothetical protein